MILIAAAFTFKSYIASKNFANDAGKFSWHLYNTIVDSKNDCNVVFSPLSIHTALAMVYMGAGGETSSEMSRALRLDTDLNKVGACFQDLLDNIDERTMKIANKMYLREGLEIKNEFNTLVTSKFNSTADNINFANKGLAVSIINDWIKEKTANKIEKLLEEKQVGAGTIAVLVNAVHFKAAWVAPFAKDGTVKQTFWVNGNQKKQVDMMTGKIKMSYKSIPDYSVVEMRYHRGPYSMLIVLPSKRNGLRSQELQLAKMPILELTENMYPAKVKIRLPKFRIEFSEGLVPVLEKMGMTKMFSAEANFTNITPTGNVQISDVLHTAYIDVNEEGTEAAAATGVVAGLTGRPRNRKFIADHPFMYLILDRQGHVYFMGRVVDP